MYANFYSEHHCANTCNDVSCDFLVDYFHCHMVDEKVGFYHKVLFMYIFSHYLHVDFVICPIFILTILVRFLGNFSFDYEVSKVSETLKFVFFV